jgi:hypothetical protein
MELAAVRSRLGHTDGSQSSSKTTLLEEEGVGNGETRLLEESDDSEASSRTSNSNPTGSTSNLFISNPSGSTAVIVDLPIEGGKEGVLDEREGERTRGEEEERKDGEVEEKEEEVGEVKEKEEEGKDGEVEEEEEEEEEMEEFTFDRSQSTVRIKGGSSLAKLQSTLRNLLLDLRLFFW